MTIITVYNKKGGVAKTTTALTMGNYLADKMKKRVLLIDFDGQGDLTRHSGKLYQKPSIYDVVMGNCLLYEAVRTIKTTTDENGNKYVSLAIIGSDPLLSALDTALADAPDASFKLRRAFSKYTELENFFDYVIIDCPPSLGKQYVNALAVSDWLLIPAYAEEASSFAIEKLVEPINTIVDVINPELKVAGILRTRVKTYGKNTTQLFKVIEKEITETARQLDCKLFKTFIRDCIAVNECQKKHMSLLDYAPDSTAAEDYTAFMKEFMEVIEDSSNEGGQN